MFINRILFITKTGQHVLIDYISFWFGFYRILQKYILMQQKLSVLLHDLLLQGFLQKSPVLGRFVWGLAFCYWCNPRL